MRTAALIAGVFHVLYAVFVASPQWFGITSSSAPGQMGLRLFTVVGCLVLAIFFFIVGMTAELPLNRLTGIISILAAAIVSIENSRFVYGTVRSATAAACESWLWRYHPVKQFAYVSGLAIPALVEISLVVFLVSIFARSRQVEPGTNLAHGSVYVRLASLATATSFVISIVLTFGSVFAVPRIHSLLVLTVLLRFATLIACAAFFLVLGWSQGRGDKTVRDSA